METARRLGRRLRTLRRVGGMDGMDDGVMQSMEDEYNESLRQAPGTGVGPDEDEEDAMLEAFDEAPGPDEDEEVAMLEALDEALDQEPRPPPRQPPREPAHPERPPPPRAPTRVLTRNVMYVTCSPRSKLRGIPRTRLARRVHDVQLHRRRYLSVRHLGSGTRERDGQVLAEPDHALGTLGFKGLRSHERQERPPLVR